MVDLIICEDGFLTVKSQEYQATYHSVHGVVDESMVVFIMAGLDYYARKVSTRPIHVFEMGLGTGLNVYFASQWAKRNQIPLHITSVEKHPIAFDWIKTEFDIWNKLSLLEEEKATFLKIHSSEWDEAVSLSEYTTLTKVKGDIFEMDLPEVIDVIFFDAFAPRTQPELWEVPLHERLFQRLSTYGVLTTYCAQGQFKRMLSDLGYLIEELPGPNKKKEMTRAIKLPV